MTKKSITLKQSQEILDNAELLFSTVQVEQAISRMARSITAQLKTKEPLMLPVMIGGIILAGKLSTQLPFPLKINYIHATRYQSTTHGGDLCWLKKPMTSLQNKTVLLIDDILDEGITLAAIIEYCYLAGAEKVWTAVLIEKRTPQNKPLKKADFPGLTVPCRYVFGYGMDYHEYHRNLPGIYALKE